MNDFERRMKLLPLRQLRPELRKEILSRCRQEAPSPSSWFKQPLWPASAAWYGMAAVWLCCLSFFIIVSLSGSNPPPEFHNDMPRYSAVFQHLDGTAAETELLAEAKSNLNVR